jgi:hypothetical protein
MGLGYSTHCPFADLEPSARRNLPGIVIGDDHQLLRVLIERGQLPGSNAEERNGSPEYRLQQLGQLEFGRKIGHGFEQGLLLVGTPAFGLEQASLVLEQPRAGYRYAGLVGRYRENLEVGLAESFRMLALHHQDADRTTVYDERYVHFRSTAQPRYVERLARDVRGVMKLSIMQRQRTESFVPRQPEVFRYI